VNDANLAAVIEALTGALTPSRLGYLALIGLVAVERLAELVVSRRNLASVTARGGLLADARTLRSMAAFQVAFLLACPLETVLLHRPWVPALGLPMLVVAVLAMALRYWAVTTLGDRWNVRIAVVPGEPVVTSGPFRHVRHPNYLALAAETVALPLVHTAWLTAAVSLGILIPLLARRIRIEESVLARHTDWSRAMAGRGRLLP
jgi:methyltransferase